MVLWVIDFFWMDDGFDRACCSGKIFRAYDGWVGDSSSQSYVEIFPNLDPHNTSFPNLCVGKGKISVEDTILTIIVWLARGAIVRGQTRSRACFDPPRVDLLAIVVVDPYENEEQLSAFRMEEVQALQNASENQEDVEPLVTVNAYFVEPLVVIPQLVQPFLFLPDTAIVTHQVMEGSTVGVIIAEDFILENPKADVDEDKAQDLKVETMFGDMGANFEVSSGVVLEEIIARKRAEKIKDGKAVTKGFNNVEKTLEKKSKKKSKGKGTIKPSREFCCSNRTWWSLATIFLH
ncbi:hypothetical protein AMTR_s00017p00181070 [Amborella trichopoda]|uniref:Uncharacterized protein n=1 Tax=Amborella trichopoda TaxID=13333 RepID=W1PLQ8_AMBTC|nr:hypothetical protein AMTR_s00017p00181070 [Amborella trichopoda]